MAAAGPGAVPPAAQRLSRHRRAAAGLEDGLVMHLQGAAADRLGQLVGPSQAARRHPRADLLVEHHQGVATFILAA